MSGAGRLVPGAAYLGDGRCRFVVWAPEARSGEVAILAPEERTVSLERVERGYHVAVAEGIAPGTRYRIRLEALGERPDPASRFQPEGVHGPSEVVDPSFPWKDRGWTGIALEDCVFYEIHVGTFTKEGTFDAAVPHLDGLRALGVSAIEVMPVAQFPGKRNWGYDGVFPYAVQDSYGGPLAFRRFVDACHERGLAVVLDVVYNHLGPEGNYLWGTAPYFTDAYRTPWGPAMNFDGAWSDEVRDFFVENALHWVQDFHVDALRLDAVHAIVDPSARPFLEELGGRVHAAARESGRRVFVIAESDRNDPRLVRSLESGGLGLDAFWNDDLHHALHTLLTGERMGYYEDFGRLEDLARSLREGFVFSGRFSVFRGRRHGSPARGVAASQFVVFAQNHDQVGNRMLGERLSSLVPFEKQKLAAGVVLLSPFVPLLFMGEEYGETAPFLYFVDHSEPALLDGVRRGRREEFARFRWSGEPPDPTAEDAFRRSRLNRALLGEPRHRALRDFHETLLAVRRRSRALRELRFEGVEATARTEENALVVVRGEGDERAFALYNFSDHRHEVASPSLGGVWKKVLDSSDRRWEGPGGVAPETIDLGGSARVPVNPSSFVLFASGSSVGGGGGR